VIEDVQADAAFAPHRTVAAASGFRAVQSTPLIDRHGRLHGVLSTHFHAPHRPPERELRVMQAYARQLADSLAARVA
jgi:GAF domain-containing protein